MTEVNLLAVIAMLSSFMLGSARAAAAAIVDTQTTPAPVVTHGGHRYTLAFSRATDAGWHVVRRDADGDTVLTADLPGHHWIWGTRDNVLLLLSQANADGGAKGWRTHRMLADGKQFTRVHADTVADGYVDRSPDGQTWAAERRVGAHKRIVFFAENSPSMRVFGAEDVPHDDADPQFSPDGQRLLFRSNRSGAWELHTADLEGRNAAQLTRDDTNNTVNPHEYGGEGPPRWSPDGKHIVWMRKFPERGHDLWVMDADGTNAKPLTDNGTIDDAYPSWSPDGRSIAFDSNRDGNNEIYVMNADGSDVVRVTDWPKADLAPVWIRID